MKKYDADITITLHGQLHNITALNMMLAKSKINKMSTADLLFALELIDRDTEININDCILLSSVVDENSTKDQIAVEGPIEESKVEEVVEENTKVIEETTDVVEEKEEAEEISEEKVEEIQKTESNSEAAPAVIPEIISWY